MVYLIYLIGTLLGILCICLGVIVIKLMNTLVQMNKEEMARHMLVAESAMRYMAAKTPAEKVAADRLEQENNIQIENYRDIMEMEKHIEVDRKQHLVNTQEGKEIDLNSGTWEIM